MVRMVVNVCLVLIALALKVSMQSTTLGPQEAPRAFNLSPEHMQTTAPHYLLKPGF